MATMPMRTWAKPMELISKTKTWNLIKMDRTRIRSLGVLLGRPGKGYGGECVEAKLEISSMSFKD